MELEKSLLAVHLGRAVPAGQAFSQIGGKFALSLQGSAAEFEAQVEGEQPSIEIHRTDATGRLTIRPLLSPLQPSKAVLHGSTAVYPDKTSAVVFTPRPNGIKEDIVLGQSLGDTLTFEWALEMGAGLHASLDERGDVRIHEGKRLVYLLPAPVIRHTNGQAPLNAAHFELLENRLRLTATGLDAMPYPLTIDPTLVVTSSADFGLGGNDEGGVDITATDLMRGRTTIGAGAWAATTSFTTLRERHTSVSYNGYVYVIGGTNPAYLNDVQVAALNSNGTTGGFAATTAFPTARAGHSSVAYNGYLYVMGGTNGGYLNDVQVAPINSTGTLGPFTATTPFATGRAGHTSIAYNGYLYVVGGFDGTTRRTDVQVARINANGTVGAWSTTTALGTGRERHANVVQNDVVYVLGGYTGAARLNDVQMAKLNPDGTLGPWVASSSFVTGREGHTAVLQQGYLYVMGGYDGAARVNDVQVAPVLGAGGVGGWVNTGTFTTAREGHTGIGYKGYVFVLGGFNGTTRLADVQAAPLNTSGTLTTAWTTTTALPSGAYQSSSVAYNGFIYNIGGTGALAASRYARINADGTLGAWTNMTALGVNRFAHWIVAYNNFLYVLGGYDSTFRNTVYYAPINADGSIGAWATTTPFGTARREHKAIAYNGFMYVIGGENGGALSSVEYAPINANGTVGAWATTTAFTTARSCATNVVHNGFMYTIGGFIGPDCSGGTNPTANTQYAPINANGTLGAWTATTPLPTARESMGFAIHNGKIYLAGGYESGAVRKVNMAQINTNGTLGAWQTLPNLPANRDWTHAVAQDGFFYSIGGTGGGSNAAVYMAGLADGPDGTVGTWNTTTALGTARSGHARVAYRGNLYVLGGRTGSFLNDVQRATINPGGTVGAWSATSAFTTARAGHTSVECNGYLYVLGGFDGTTRRNDVQYAPINADGTAGAWVTTTAFATGREHHTSVCYNGYLYVAGGFDGTTRRTDVQVAPINANGTVGAWSTTTALPTGRERHSTVVQDGYLYVIGGFDGTNRLNEVQAAPINASGTLGAWAAKPGVMMARENLSAVAYGGHLYTLGGNTGAYQSTVEVASFVTGGIGNWQFSKAFATPRDGHSTVAYEGYLYVIGGTNGTLQSDVQVAALGTATRRASYSKLIDFGSTVTVDTLTLNGLATKKGTVSVEYRTAPASAVLGTSVDLGVVPLGSAIPLNVSGVRYLWTRLTLDDSRSDVANVDGVSERDVSDFSVVYTPGGPPTQLAFVGSVSSAAAGATLTSVQVAIQDSGGSTATSSTATVTLALGANPGGSTLGGTVSVTAVNGIATFSNLSLNKVGTGYTLTASSAGLTGATSNAFNITPGTATRIAVLGVSTPRLINAPSDVTLVVQDGYGNRVTNYFGTVRLSSTDSTATLPPAYAFTAGDSGSHTFPSGVAFNQQGLFSLTAADMSLASMAGTLSGILVQNRQGAACTADSDCGTGICASGVCCATVCTDVCSACNNPGSVGTCSPRPNGAACADATYCNGTETCQGGSCTPGTPVVCTDPGLHDVLTCDEAGKTCSIVPQSPPSIVHDAVLSAGEGKPYVFNAQQAVNALGDRPMTFSVCGGPADFKVDPASGAVTWTPSVTGVVNLCVAATNAYGLDTYSFAVTVSMPTGALPTAAFSATPPEGTAPLPVLFDASASTADPSTSLVLYRWEFGQGGPPGSGVSSSALFRVPGGEQVTLNVFDGFGRNAQSKQSVRVLSPDGARPPLARIVASAVSGPAPLASSFSCDCSPGDAPILGYYWDFADGSTSGAAVHRIFNSGRRRVRLTVVDAAGLTATDSVEVVVADTSARPPPTCHGWASPSGGVAPMSALLRATSAQPRGSISSATWSLWDVTKVTGPDVRRTLSEAGHSRANLLVVDDAGLTCEDEIWITVTQESNGQVPPYLWSVPTTKGSCGEQASFADGVVPVISGSGPAAYSVEPLPGEALPEGMGVDAATGQLDWRPTRMQQGPHAFLLRVTTPAGTDARPVSVDIECVSRSVAVGCGCQALDSGNASWALLLIAAAASRARCRRRR
ncbi:MAG: Kelch repeat-containing protein [Myxococcaceae bacterium]